MYNASKIGNQILSGTYRRNYLNDPETKLLATRCAVCQKSLKDAVSITRGIGPDCYGKYYIEPGGITAEQRAEANAIVHYIAVKAKGDEAIIACKALEDLGFTVLAGRIARRLVQVRVDRHAITAGEYEGKVICAQKNLPPEHFHVFAPYHYAYVSKLKAIPGARFVVVGNKKGWGVPIEQKPALWAALQVFAGAVGVSPEGKMFVVGGAEAAKPVTQTVPGMPGYVAVPTA